MSNRPTPAGVANPPTVPPSSAVRAAATSAHRILTVAILVCVAAQFFLAGLGVFSRQRQSVSDGYFGPHVALGLAIGFLTLLLAASALLSRAGSPIVPISLALVVLTGLVEPLLASLGDSASAWFGALHALTGVLIAALTGTLFTRGQRGEHVLAQRQGRHSRRP